MTVFHSFCNASTSAGGEGDRAEEKDISEADDAIEDVVFERERPVEADSSEGAGIGTESTSNCPLLKALERNGLRSSMGTSEKSAGPRVLSAS